MRTRLAFRNNTIKNNNLNDEMKYNFNFVSENSGMDLLSYPIHYSHMMFYEYFTNKYFTKNGGCIQI